MGTMKLINRNFELNDEIKELEIKWLLLKYCNQRKIEQNHFMI
jgi:hypothetical protein